MRNVVVIAAVAAAGLVGGCDKPLTTPQKGAITGAALGTGIGMVSGASFPVVIGAGLIGGAAGYITGNVIDDNKK